MDLFYENNIDIWRKEWSEAISTSPMTRRLIRTEEEQIERWDKVAGLFSKNKRPPDREEAEKNIIRSLTVKGALKPGDRVLDIGAGFGHLTFRLAEIAGHVIAIEPSGAMVDNLKRGARSRGIKNITVDQCRWQDIDPETEAMGSGFDLVVASMSPGVQGSEDLEKMNLVSRGFCYLSRFSGLRGFYGFNGIWESFFNEDPGVDPWDIIYPFNLLYAMGYRPSLDFIVQDAGTKVAIDEARKRILASLWNYMDETHAVAKAVEEFVAARSDQGVVRYEKKFCQGMMIWQADTPVL